MNRLDECDTALEAFAAHLLPLEPIVALPGQHIVKPEPRTLLTDRRIHVHNQHRHNDYIDRLILNTNMSDLIGRPNQAWNLASWTRNELNQLASQFSQDLYPSVPTLQLDSNPLQPPLLLVPSIPLCQYHTQDFNQLLGTTLTLQQAQWNFASRGQSNQNAMPSIQQDQLSLPGNIPGGTTYVAPRLSMTTVPSHYLSPEPQSQPTPTQLRHTSAMSSPSSAFDFKISEVSRSVSPNLDTLTVFGFKEPDNSWSCAWLGCPSRVRFSRACDLRKHYKRHWKTVFCRYDGCPQSREAGFSSKKDRARHETKHNPMIMCKWENCGRLFGRVDNMVRLCFLHHTAQTYCEAFC